MENYLPEIVLVFSFTLLSAFFAASETALFSLKKPDLHRFFHSRRAQDRRIAELMVHPERILVTILLGSLFSNLVISAVSTKLLLGPFGEFGHFLSIALVAPLIIIVCEISPKILAVERYESASRRFFPLLMFFHHFFFPARYVLVVINDFMMKIFGLKIPHKSVTEDELDFAVHMGQKEGAIEEEEEAFIKNVLRFSKKTASNIMFPRNRAVFIPYGASIKEAMSIFTEHGIIRAPVFKGDLDHVVGLLDSKDLLPYHLGYKNARNINRFLHKINYYPATRELNDLLKDFLNEGIQLAILVDEYGGTAGVVTLNAILSQLMSSRFNRWETDLRGDIRKIDDNLSVVPGEMQISDFNAHFHESIGSEEAETIGGFIVEVLGRFPVKGEIVNAASHMLRVRRTGKNKIISIDVMRNP